MKAILSAIALGLGLAIAGSAMAQNAPPVTKVDCEKARGAWDEASQKCVLPK